MKEIKARPIIVRVSEKDFARVQAERTHSGVATAELLRRLLDEHMSKAEKKRGRPAKAK